MIPQSKLSLISNKIYAHSGFRIPEMVIERDYCISWLLLGLSQSNLKKSLAFKGGTALRRCFFPDYRFSEDLDFTSIDEASFEDILKELKEIFSYIRQESGIMFDLGKKEDPTENTYTFYVTYIGPFPGKEKEIKVDITYREKIIHSLVNKAILKSYEEYTDFPTTGEITVYSLSEIAIEKACALLSPARNEPRDLYDIHYLIQNAGVNMSHLASDVDSKFQFKGTSLNQRRGEFEKKEIRLRKLWEHRLSTQVILLPKYDDIYRAVKRNFSRAGLLNR